MSNDYPERRNLDALYCCVEREGKLVSVCFTDMTPEEQTQVLHKHNASWLIELAKHLAYSLRQIGDELDVHRENK